MFIKNYPYCAQRVFIVLLMFGQAFAQTSSDTVMRADSSVSALNNPYGLEALWVGSDSITKFVLLLLLVMSVSSWYIIVSKILLNKKMSGQAAQADEFFWSGDTVTQGVAKLDTDSPYRFIAESGASAVKTHIGLKKNIPSNDWIEMNIQSAVDTIQNSSQNGLSFLATVGSTSPFVGLFGTVWGIYHALTAIGISGQASIDKVAGPVGEALIMTAIGLAVAIPAVLGYNYLAKANKTVMDDVKEFSEELNGVLVGSDGRAA
jgi:biopolymer transport protein ExbB